MTKHDFYDLVRRHWPLPIGNDPWDDYVAGRCTHFEALAAIFARIRADEPTMEALLTEMELDPALPTVVHRLTDAGWRIVVTSAGCAWYEERLLARVKLQLEVHANPGTFSPDSGLILQLPKTSRFFSPSNGIDKVALVRDALSRADVVAFAGDGRPDLEPALLVPSERRFARGWLAEALRARGEGFQAFDSWNQIGQHLLQTEKLC